MGHIGVTVLISSQGDDEESICREIDRVLAPYDMELEVEPYRDECWCVEEGADPKCGDCHGTGQSMETMNPEGKWDWWVVGGRYSGFFGPKDIVPAVEIPPGAYTFALVTPDGKWHEDQRSVKERSSPEWVEKYHQLLSNHRDCLAVLVDCHE